MIAKLDRTIGSRATRNFCLNQGLNAFATRGFDVAIVWIALTEAGSTTSAGLVLFFKFLPYTAFGLLGGWLGDHLSRWRLIAVSDAMRGVLLLVAAASVAHGGGTWTLSAISFLFTTFRTVSQPASQSFLLDLVEARALGRANAWLHGSSEAMQMISPAATGLLLTVAPPWAPLVALALVFSTAAFLVPRTENANGAPLPHEMFSVRNLFASYRLSLARTRRGRPDAVLSIFIVPIAILGVGGLIDFSIPDFLLQKGGFPPSYYGMVLAAMSFGTLPGAFVAGTIAAKDRFRAIYASWFAYGAFTYLLSTLSDIAGLVLCSAAAGVVGAVADVSFATHVQESAKKEDVSKLFATFSTMANGCQALSAPMMAGVTACFSIRYSFMLGLVLVVVASACGLIIGLRLRPRPLADAAEGSAP